MVAIPAGSFRMGSARFYAEEAPVRDTAVSAFRIDRHPITNRQFAAFVADTGYVTLAERDRMGALVFRPSITPIALDDWRQWWTLRRDANWRKPDGKTTVFASRLDHPVVAVAHEDAVAYAGWVGKRLPSEAEWEYAARGAGETDYAWGDAFEPGGQRMANTWQGRFPIPSDRRQRWWTTPVGSFPANGFGLGDMIGNVWEWTSDRYGEPDAAAPACCGGKGADDMASFVIKGGSFLCSPDYCARYRPAARQPQTIDTASCHIGFRCAAD